MGWLFKGFLVLVAFALIGAGVWWLGAVVFVYLAFSLRRGRKRVERTIVVTQPGVAAEGAQTWNDGGRRRKLGFQWRWRYLLGAIFLLAALIAASERGTFSPLVFGGLGMFCFLWAPLSRRGFIPAYGFAPVGESTLLRSILVPFQWASVLELKLSSQESARALSVLHDDFVVIAPPSEKPSVYLIVKEEALGYRSAEARMSEKLRRLASVFASRGVYLMPLDSADAARLFRPGCRNLKMEVDSDSALAAVAHAPYDMLLVKPQGVYAKSLGGYIADPTTKEGDLENGLAGRSAQHNVVSASPPTRATLPAARESFGRPPLLWEVVSCLLERFRFSEPDAFTMFLNNMHLSRGAPPGVKMSLANGGTGERSNGSTLAVESLGGAPVELTRAQLRMIVKMYD